MFNRPVYLQVDNANLLNGDKTPNKAAVSVPASNATESETNISIEAEEDAFLLEVAAMEAESTYTKNLKEMQNKKQEEEQRRKEQIKDLNKLSTVEVGSKMWFGGSGNAEDTPRYIS